MSTSITTTIVKAYCLVNNKGSFIFNDKLKDGTRSVKVWQWDAGDYMTVAQQLRKAGCAVSIRVGRSTRLWVSEPRPFRTAVLGHVY